MRMKVIDNVSVGYGIALQHKKNSNYNKRKNTKNNNGGIKVHIGFNASGTMAKIAAANTKPQVSAIERSLRVLLKDAIRYDSDESTIKAIKRAIGKAGFKVKALGKEERMENVRKSAEAAENHRVEEKIRKDLVAKRKARKHKERAEIADTNSVISKQHNKYLGNTVDVTSEGIQFPEGIQNTMALECTTTSVIDMCL